VSLRLALPLLLVAACSGAPGDHGATEPGPAAGHRGDPRPAGGAGGTAGASAGDLDGCNPAGTWLVDGNAQGTGTCASPVPTLHLELVVQATAGHQFAARRADGALLRLERVRGARGACELDLEELARSTTGPNLVLFYHLADAGTGLALRDEYEPGADFRPETGKIHCTEGYDLTIKRAK
jgi:hypothetical protein